MAKQNNRITPKIGFWKSLRFVATLPITIPRWIVSFFFARMLAHVTLDPSHTKRQKQIHLVHVSDETHASDDIVVVNLMKREKNKTIKDHMLKFKHIMMKLPFLAPDTKRMLHFDKASDKQHIDKLITEIHALVEGTSTAAKCEKRSFSWDKIHFKGLEFLDEKLKTYFFASFEKKHGNKAQQMPRSIHLDFFTTKTHDGALLDSVATSPIDEEKKPFSERKFVITCLPRQQNFINWIKDIHYSSKHIGCTVISFNYRGVDYSKGVVWTEKNMVDDTIAQVERLIHLGANPKNIGLEGGCLGAAVATLAAAKLHECDCKVKLYNERSFRSLPRFLIGYLLPKPNSSLLKPLTLLKYITVGLVFVFIVPFIWLCSWKINAAKAWDSIPHADKDYSVVRLNVKTKHRQPKEADGMVHDSWASMASLLDEKRETLLAKQKRGRSLTKEELAILTDKPESHHFKPGPLSENAHNDTAKKYGKASHFLPRRSLVTTLESVPLKTNHDHMIDCFKGRLGL